MAKIHHHHHLDGGPTRSGPFRSLLFGVLVAHHQHPATVSSQNTIARIRRHASASYCIERAGLDFDLLGYPSRPAAQAPPFPHHPYSHHHNDQHVSAMNVKTMTIPAALAPPLPTSYIKALTTAWICRHIWLKFSFHPSQLCRPVSKTSRTEYANRRDEQHVVWRRSTTASTP